MHRRKGYDVISEEVVHEEQRIRMRRVVLPHERAIVYRSGTTTMPDDPAVEFHNFNGDFKLGDGLMFKFHYFRRAAAVANN